MAVLDTIVEAKVKTILNIGTIEASETFIVSPTIPSKSIHIGSFLNECKSDRLKSELLSFWGRHPNANFTWNAIYYAMDFCKSDVVKTLDCFIEKGIIDTHKVNDYMFYSLTNNKDVRYLIMQIWPDKIHRHLSNLY